MKKMLAVFLATVMLFAVCAMSAFAIGPYSTNDYERSPIEYFPGRIECEGTLSFNPASRYFYLALSCKNISYYDVLDYGFHGQCAINYSDETYDFFTMGRRLLISPEDKRTISENYVLPSDKTIISFDAEFAVSYGNTLMWEGYIYETYVMGINA